MAKVAEGRSPVMFAHIGTPRALHGEPQSALGRSRSALRLLSGVD